MGQDIRREIQVYGVTGRPVTAAVDVVGEGTPLVFLHGMLGLNRHWRPVTDRLRDRARCYMFELPLLDLRGDDCSVEAVTAMAMKFVEDTFDEPVVLLGSSLGGHIALRIAIDRPDSVKGLVLAGSSGTIENPISGSVQIRPSREWVRNKIGSMFYDPSNITEPELTRVHAELNQREGARSIVKLTRSCRKDHLGDRLPFIKAPTLLIWGRNDQITPPEAAHAFMSHLSNASIHWLDQCGHAPMVEHPDAFADRVRTFLAQIEGTMAQN